MWILIIGRTTKRESPLQSINNLTSSAMPSKHPSRISPPEGFSIARQVRKDAVTFYLENGGPAVAREHVENLAKELIIYDDCTEAYREAMAKINMAEKAERQKKAHHDQEFNDLLKAIMKNISPAQQAQQPANDKANQKKTVMSELPEKLRSPEAMRIWRILQEAGYIDEHYQPVGLTRTEASLLAEQITIQLADENDNLLDIKEWKPYETLWCRKNMKADLRRALTQDKTPEFRDKIKRLFK